MMADGRLTDEITPEVLCARLEAETEEGPPWTAEVREVRRLLMDALEGDLRTARPACAVTEILDRVATPLGAFGCVRDGGPFGCLLPGQGTASHAPPPSGGPACPPTRRRGAPGSGRARTRGGHLPAG